MNKPSEKLTTAIAELTEHTKMPGIDAYKVVYQFVGNNHMMRNNTLVFFCESAEKARTMGTKFLSENNLPWFKVLSVQRA